MTILMNGLGYETLCSDRPELIKLKFPGEMTILKAKRH